MTIISIVIIFLIVATLCSCCYFLGRIDQTLANLKAKLPPPPRKERRAK